MRHYGLAEWLETISQSTGIDVATLVARHVDLDRAILALRTGGGEPTSNSGAEDVAQGAHRLLDHLLRLRPYRAQDRDRATLAAITAYAAARGYHLDLGPRRMHFIEELDLGGLGEDEALRALRQALTPIPPPARTVSPPLLLGCRLALSLAVSDPTPDLVKITRYLRTGLDRWVQRHGGELYVPRPQSRQTSTGEHIDIPYRDEGDTPATTDDIFTRSIHRLTGTHVQVILADPRSSGSAVEREWALRCGKPIFEVAMSFRIHPHADAPPAVTTIRLDALNPTATLNRLCEELTNMAWQIHDARATADAVKLKNDAECRQLRDEWEALDNQRQLDLASTAQMSRPYIRGLLSNPSALELASAAQRTALAALLGVHVGRSATPAAALTEGENRRLTSAGMRAGLAGYDLVHAVQIATQEWRRAYSYSRLTEDAEADASIAAAIEHLRATTREDDWS